MKNQKKMTHGAEAATNAEADTDACGDETGTKDGPVRWSDLLFMHDLLMLIVESLNGEALVNLALSCSTLGSLFIAERLWVDRIRREFLVVPLDVPMATNAIVGTFAGVLSASTVLGTDRGANSPTTGHAAAAGMMASDTDFASSDPNASVAPPLVPSLVGGSRSAPVRPLPEPSSGSRNLLAHCRSYGKPMDASLRYCVYRRMSDMCPSLIPSRDPPPLCPLNTVLMVPITSDMRAAGRLSMNVLLACGFDRELYRVPATKAVFEIPKGAVEARRVLCFVVRSTAPDAVAQGYRVAAEHVRAHHFVRGDRSQIVVAAVHASSVLPLWIHLSKMVLGFAESCVACGWGPSQTRDLCPEMYIWSR